LPDQAGPRRQLSSAASSEPYGINAMFNRSTGPTLANYTRDANIGWVRLQFYWDELQPTRGGTLTSAMDQGVKLATERNIKILGSIAYTPAWARYNQGDNKLAPHPDFYADWQQFITQLVNKYPYVTHWSIWNEPNASALFKGWTNDPWGEYIQLTKLAAPAIRAAGDKVVVAEYAYDRSKMSSQHPQITRLLNEAGSETDVVAMHMYGDQNVVVDVMKKLAGELNGSISGGWRWPLWLTETGEDLSSDQEVQRQYLQTIYQGMRSAPSSSYWQKTFYYHQIHWHGSCPTDYPIRGILDGEWKAYCYGNMSYIQPRKAYNWYKNWAWNLQVSISGPYDITSAGSYTWEAMPSGGNGTYAYKWEYSSDGSSWSQVGTNKTYSRYVDHGSYMFYLRTTVTSGVTATSSGVTSSNTRKVYVSTDGVFVSDPPETSSTDGPTS
jgi:hypothetical protein